MALVVIAGAPGSGKSTLLAELAQLGHHTVSDSAREVIRHRKSLGLPPRPTQLEFAREVLTLDTAKYQAALSLSGLVFFERCGLEALAMLPQAESLRAPTFTFHELVFVLPPWREIYVTDEERDHSFDHALRVHEEVLRVYPAHGFRVLVVPCVPPRERAAHVLHSLAAASAA